LGAVQGRDVRLGAAPGWPDRRLAWIDIDGAQYRPAGEVRLGQFVRRLLMRGEGDHGCRVHAATITPAIVAR
jgi:hypothetical protein